MGKKRKPVMTFTVDDELRDMIKAYAEKNKLPDAAAIRLILVTFLRPNFGKTNVDSGENKSDD